jgi:hypothetical protein
MTYVVWGYGNSWIVNGVDVAGQVVWSSRWMATKGAAAMLAEELECEDVKVAA